MHFDIAIIGFGPVGAAAANIFANKGFSIIVIDPKKKFGIYQEPFILMAKLKEFFNLWVSLMRLKK